MNRIKQALFPTTKENIIKYIDKFRKKYIPKRFNQIKLMEYLLDDDIDHYISISNRSDGKSFNYLNFIIKFCIDHSLGFTFIVRRYTVRIAGQKIIQKIIDTFDMYDHYDFQFMRTDHYIILIYKDRHLGIITDLNHATDLKYQSNYLQDFPIVIYDEFLALKGDYLDDEWDRLKTIYGSINRGSEDIPYINIPKLIYLGNAVNFSSPILLNLNLFNILETHPMNTIKKYGKVVLEFNKNEQANESRNLRAFDETDDTMTQGEFEINHHNIATKNDRWKVNESPNYLSIKLRQSYLKILYNTKSYEAILSVVSYMPSYDFNTNLVDNTHDSQYLTESFYDIDHDRKYNKDIFKFDNMYSKDFIMNSQELTMLKIHKVIKQHIANNKLDNFEMKEKVYKENRIENTKKALFKKFFQ